MNKTVIAVLIVALTLFIIAGIVYYLNSQKKTFVDNASEDYKGQWG